MMFVTLWGPNFCGCIVTDTGFMCEYTDQDFLRLRLETLLVILRFLCPFSEIFYLVHSLLILLQSLSCFWRPNKTIKANHGSLLTLPPHFTCSPLYCHIVLFPSWNTSWKPIHYYNHQKYSLLPRQWHLANKMMSLWSAYGSPTAFGFVLSKNLRRQIQCFINACQHTEKLGALHL